MKIWIFNPYEPLPHEGAVRLRYASLSEALIAQGHTVTWWSADWSHAHKRRRSQALESVPSAATRPGAQRTGSSESESGELYPSKLETGELKTDKQQPPLRLLYLGSMGRVYDLSTLVEAVIQLSDLGVEVHLDVIGDGEQRRQLESRVAEAEKTDVVKIHGYVQGAALDALLAQADVGVIPMHPESAVAVPYKAPHYLSHGLYVLSSLPGELMKYLEQFDCGTHYQAGDVKDLAEKIQKLAADPAALQSGKVGARQLFSEQFDRDKVYAAMADWVAARSAE